MPRSTKIVATLGPATSSPEKIRALIEAGVDVFRLNFSHGTHEQHGALIRSIRDLQGDRPIAIVFSPGAALAGQDRSKQGNDDVTECGGNYNAANYLDPSVANALGGVTNYLAGTNNADALTGDSARATSRAASRTARGGPRAR